MNRKTNRGKDRHKAETAVLVRMSLEERGQIKQAVEAVGASLPRGARTSVTAWILAQALEAARAVTAGVRA